jgi:hypothetical protein
MADSIDIDTDKHPNEAIAVNVARDDLYEALLAFGDGNDPHLDHHSRKLMEMIDELVEARVNYAFAHHTSSGWHQSGRFK